MPNTPSEPYTPLGRAVVEGGLERVPFFNGRILTAEDLQVEQEADALVRDRLGRAVGTGVLEGLWVRRDEDDPETVLVVDSGVAVNREGRSVQLPQRTRVNVVGETEHGAVGGAESGFEDCAALESVETTGTGAYLLVLEPAADTRGRVPRTELGGDGAAGSCGARRRLEGGRLKLIGVDVAGVGGLADAENTEVDELAEGIRSARAQGEPVEIAARSRLRNLLAHTLLGSFQEETTLSDPYRELTRSAQGRPAAGGAVGRGSNRPIERLISEGRLSEAAVPLALLLWMSDRIEFIDCWAVRRRLHRFAPDRVRPATDRNQAATEAATHQFQAQLGDLVEVLSRDELASIDAGEYWRILPPVGVLPVTNFAGANGIDVAEFFGSTTTTNPSYAEAPRVEALIDEASRYPPIDLEDDTFIRLYWIRENIQAVERGEAGAALLFTSGYLPDVAQARFDLSEWEYANYEGSEGAPPESNQPSN